MKQLSIRARAPAASSALVRRVMLANYGGNTGPERVLRSALRRAGLRFHGEGRVIPSLPCKADVLFPDERVCVFVDGCFWHGCRLHFSVPKTHSSWWREKVEDNRRRDRRNTARLRAAGWKVIRIWEHAIARDSMPLVLKRIGAAVGQRSG
jgi:DNA mismatch endonuclease (patch repair protein)